MGQRVREFPSPLSSPKGVICFSSLLIAINLPPLPTSCQPACPLHRNQKTGLPIRSHCLPLTCGCSHICAWHSLWAMATKDGREATNADKKIGDAYDKKGHILHLKNRHCRCSHQLKQQHLQKVSFHRRNVPNETSLYPFYRWISVAWNSRMPEVIWKITEVTVCLIFSLVGNVDTLDVK